jgi:hypothetical protein
MRINRTKVAIAAGILLASAAASSSAAASPARPLGGCTPSWNLVDTPASLSGKRALLNTVAAVSGKDVRIGGYSTTSDEPMLAAWDGRSITDATQIPAMPVLPLSVGRLKYSSGRDGWVLTQNRFAEMAQRWHGGRWTMTPLAAAPDPEHTTLGVHEIQSISANDAWAVGATYKGGTEVMGGTVALGALIEHWDGTAWQIVANPVADEPDAELTSVDARSATDIWAVGLRKADGSYQPLLEHYDGADWTVVTPPADNGNSGMREVSVAPDGTAVAVGSQVMPGTANDAMALVDTFDGKSWHRADLPDLGNGRLNNVYTSGANNVWAIFEVPNGANTFVHWDGATWTSVEAPGPKERGLRYLYSGIDGTGPNDVWAVGGVTDMAAITEPQVAHLSCGGK